MIGAIVSPERARRIGWTAQKSQVREGAGNHFRIRNDARTLRAQVVAVSDNFVGEPGESMLFNVPTLPAVVEPGNWLPLAAHQILGQDPIAVTVCWRQAKLGSEKFGAREYVAKIYL